MSDKKTVLILARRNLTEAMRVAAGMTIFGHGVKLALMSRALTTAESESDEAELLELAEVEMVTTVSEMAASAPLLTPTGLATAIAESDFVLSI